jgi:hypothetical protein
MAFQMIAPILGAALSSQSEKSSGGGWLSAIVEFT